MPDVPMFYRIYAWKKSQRGRLLHAKAMDVNGSRSLCGALVGPQLDYSELRRCKKCERIVGANRRMRLVPEEASDV